MVEPVNVVPYELARHARRNRAYYRILRQRHHVTITDELFSKAANTGGSVQRHAQRQLHQATRNDPKQNKAAADADDLNCGVFKNLRCVYVSA